MTATPAYTPYGAADAMWRCRAPEVLIPGPAGTGKTRAVLEKIHLVLMGVPRARAAIVRATRASMTQSVLVTLEDEVFAPGFIKGGAKRDHRTSYVYPNGSELVVAGLDNPDRLMSTQYDLIAVFEGTEITEDGFEKLTTRLRNGRLSYQQIIVDCNPAHPAHWVKRRADAGKMSMFQSRHQDNPMLWDMEKGEWTKRGSKYIPILFALTGPRRARLAEGKWAASEGLVYPEFDPAVHVIRKMPDGWEHWRRFRSVDFGYVHPFVCQWWAVDGDGRMYLYREIYHTKRTVLEHAKQIVQLSQGENHEITVTDHDTENCATLTANGVPIRLACKDTVAGRDATHARLRVQADGRPRIFFLADCAVEVDTDLYARKMPTNTVAEFDSYAYPPGKDGKAAKEEPVKMYDDGCDCCRYAIMHLDATPESLGAWVGSNTGMSAAEPVSFANKLVATTIVQTPTIRDANPFADGARGWV